MLRSALNETRLGSFEDLLAETEPSLRPVAVRQREVVFEVHSQAVEVVRLGDRAATYGLGPSKMSEGYCYVLPAGPMSPSGAGRSTRRRGC